MRIDANIHIHHCGNAEEILSKLRQIMVDLSRLQTAVEQQTTVTQSAITLIQGLADEIRNTPATQAALDELADRVQSEAQKLADAVTTNTPSE